MTNPADKIVERQSIVQTPTRDRKNGDELKFYEDNKRFLAKVTASTPDPDVWKLKLYEKGYGTLTTPQDPTSEEILGYTVQDQDFVVGQRIQVVLRRNNIAMIVADNFPKDTGFGKVWMIIDDQSPGNTAFDYTRFTKRGI